MEETTDNRGKTVEAGATVYDEDGNALGTVQNNDAQGFYVAAETDAGMPVDEHRTTGMAGEAELTWRCSECGTIGKLKDMPENGCTDCGAPQEAIYYHLQD
jgi:rubrerythrin